MSAVCLIGGSGFLGSRVLQRAMHEKGQRLRVLAHRRTIQVASGVAVLQGDASDPRILDELLVAEAVVLNLAYGGEHTGEQLARVLAEACARKGVRRLVHVSTCSVYGRTPGREINEESACDPVTPYERTKHAIEKILEAGARGYELAVLRPTAIFGVGGRNFESLIGRVLRGGRPARYLRACVMGRRRMNAVDVECVAAAVQWLASAPMMSPVERFIVSQDDEPANDYASVEAFFARRFGVAPYPFPALALPPRLFSLVLGLAGRSVTDPERRCSAAKLASRGFRPPRTFQEALEEYAASFTTADARP